MTDPSLRTFAVQAKPVGGACNLRCSYCYYRDRGTRGPMSPEVLEAYILQTLRAHGRNAEVEFSWHGGEPTLAGLDFFRRAVELERLHGAGRRIRNTLQTNGILLDDPWCRFFRDHRFLVGVSLDGPRALHDRYRGGFDATWRGIRRLRAWGVPFNLLATVNAATADHPEEVYDFLAGTSEGIQFLPVVERKASGEGMTEDSVEPEAYGRFLCRVWDRWRSRDVGRVFVTTFEAALNQMVGRPAGICVHEPTCGHAVSVEADGEVCACDRFPGDRYGLGNLLTTPLEELLERNRPFGMHKAEGLAQACRDCPHLGLCWGGCPRDRHDGTGRLGGGPEAPPAPGDRAPRVGVRNYLCEGYGLFFSHLERCVQVGP